MVAGACCTAAAIGGDARNPSLIITTFKSWLKLVITQSLFIQQLAISAFNLKRTAAKGSFKKTGQSTPPPKRPADAGTLQMRIIATQETA